jgi:hypothetical protein
MTGLLEALQPRPLAERLRPRALADVVGKDHLLVPTAPQSETSPSRRLGNKRGAMGILSIQSAANETNFLPVV